MPRPSLAKRKAFKRNQGKHIRFKWLFIVLAFLLFLLLLFLLRTKYWNSNGKFSVVGSLNGDVVIYLYDTKSDSQTRLIIPGNTQVLASYGLGTWKLDSLWKLGLDEKIGGGLVVRSLAKNFGFPVYIWEEKLTMGDKLRIKLFSLLNKGNEEIIDLRKTGFLKQTVFIDGEKGYVVNKDAPEDVLSFFSEQEEFGSELKAKITDLTGMYGISEKVGRVIETMGIKVAAISKNSNTPGDCKVSGNNKKLIHKVALILDCSEVVLKDTETFDIELDLYNKFAQEF